MANWPPINFEITGVAPAAAPVLQVGVSGGDGHPDGDILRSPDGGKTWNGTRCYRSLFDVRVLRDKSWAAVGSVRSGLLAPTSELYTHQGCRALYSRDGGETWRVSKGSDGEVCLRLLAVPADGPILAGGRPRPGVAGRRRWRLVGKGADQLDYGGFVLGRLRRQIGRRGR